MRRLLVLGFVVCACSKAGAPQGKASRPGIADPARLLAGVPADAALVVMGEVPGPLTHVDWLLDDEGARAMASELEAYLTQRTGLTVGMARSGAFFLRGQDFAVVIHDVGGELKGAGADGLVGVAGLTLARRDTLLIAGDAPAVRASLDVLDEKLDAMRPGSSLLADLLVAEAKGAELAAGVSPAAVILPPLRPLFDLGVGEGVIALRGGGLRAVLTGPDDKLEKVAQLMRGGLDALAQSAEAEKSAATDGDLLEGAAAIALAHHAAFLRRVAQPKVAKERLVVEIDHVLDDGMMLIPLVGIAAAVAIPAFMKNARKAKTSEAITLVKMMYDGARTSAEEASPPAVPQGHAGPTPPLGDCCKQGGKCQPAAALWKDPLWQALKFSVDDPHYYSYSYTGQGSSFSASAYGDLDCDGQYSTFEIVGELGADGTVTGGAGLFRNKELE